ncbi:MAG: DUF885 domain-containing protein [Cyclobacteriaceae bacterium]
MRYLYSFLFVVTCFSIQAQDSTAIEKIFAEIDRIDERYSVDGAYSGKHPEKYEYKTTEQLIAQAAEYQEQIALMRSLPREELSRQEQISRDIMILRLNDDVSAVKYKTYLMPFNAEGGFYNSPVFFLSRLPFDDIGDYESYLNWLPSFADYIRYNQELLGQGIKENVLRPKLIVNNNIELLSIWIKNEVEENPFYRPFQNMPESISPEDQKRLIKRANKVIRESILPAYQDLGTFLKDTYLPASPEEVGISSISNGRSYYEDRIRFYTTMDMSPDSVYSLGLQEVARISAKMRKIIADLEFEGDFAAFINFLRTDPQFYAKTPQELLNKAAWLSKKAEGQLPPLFSKLYSLPFTVEPVPDAIAPNYTGGRAVPGDRKANLPGIYWVNTYDLPSRTLYTLPALTLHEAVPGHHLQISLSSELEGLPAFRTYYYISAFGEGWGLYSEYLGEEMGMYETPYDLFGRYTYEMWRACRLVVDVGLHYKGWTRQEAVDYLASNTALSLHEVSTEIDRYIGWPGQAVSYKIGELTIIRLREEATKALGEAFDIQKFHELILQNGSVPLPVLEEEINSYIESTK